MEFDVNKYYAELVDWIVHYTPKVFLAIILFIVGRFIIRKVQKFLHHWIEKSEIDNETSTFLQSFLGIILTGILIILIIPILGIELSAIIGMLAAVGFAVGLALQGFLGNFAAGLTIIFLKPYRVGDWVEISESFGRVDSIHIFNTILKTPGDKTLVIPNGQVTDNIITNFSTVGQIRLEITVPIGYEQDFPQIKKIILDALAQMPLVLQKPEPYIGIESYDTHNINVTVRPYILPDNFWEATFQVNEGIKKALSNNAIQMTYSEGIENGPIGQ